MLRQERRMRLEIEKRSNSLQNPYKTRKGTLTQIKNRIAKHHQRPGRVWNICTGNDTISMVMQLF